MFTRIKLFLVALLVSLGETVHDLLMAFMGTQGLIRYTTLSPTAVTYADWAKRLDPNGTTAMIVEMLSQSNPIMDDMLVVEANGPTSHRTTVRTGLPTATWRLLNYGVAPSKSTTAQVTDSIGMLETFSQIDKSLADLNGNTVAFRASEDMAFVEAMSQQMATTVFYGNTGINPERFMGLSPRYNATSSATAQTALNVIDAGGTASTNTSIWVACWGSNTMHAIFPKGQKAGLQQVDLGDAVPLTDANGNLYRGYRTHFKWDIGMTDRDWRFAIRIANIDVSLLSTGSAANLINALIRAVNRLPVAPVGVNNVQTSDAPSVIGSKNCVIYCNRTIQTYLEIQALNKTNVLLNIREYNGIVVTTFRGIPIRPCDALVNTESRIV